MPELARNQITSPFESDEAAGARNAQIALIWADIGNYHAARSLAADELARVDVQTIEILGSSEYWEFRAGATQTAAFPCHRLGIAPPLNASAARVPLHRLLSRLNPQVVFTPGWSSLESLLTMEWCVRAAVPFVIMSDSKKDDFPRTAVRERIKRRLVGMASAALVAGAPQAEYAQELGLAPSQIFFGYDVVDNGHFRTHAACARQNAKTLREELGLPERYFLCCARLIKKKNMPRLIEAFAQYRQTAGLEAWDLVIVGPGSTASIDRQIDLLGLNGAVRLSGPKGYQDLPKYYGLAGAFILPSTTEQWGLVVNEAMAAGLPVLVSNRCGCARDLVEEGRNGFTFDPFDVGSMAETMGRVASASCDRASMGAASQATIANWGPERFAAGFEAAARAALNRPQKRPLQVDRWLLHAMTLK